MIKVLARVCAAAAFASVIGAPLRAQTAQPISVQLSALYEGVYGDAFEDLRPGAGFEAQVRYTRGAWSVGFGYQTVGHRYGFCYVRLSGGGCGRVIPARMTGSGVFFEPRYVFDAGSDVFAPYVSGRFSIVRQRDSADPLYESSVTGSSANGGGGLLYRITPRVNFDAGATFGYTRFSRYRAVDKETGAVLTGPIGGESGANFVLRVGVAIGLGG